MVAIAKQIVTAVLAVSSCMLVLPLRQAIADLNVVVVLDDSGSMNEVMRTGRQRIRKIDAAKQALAKVLEQLPPNTQVGVLALNSKSGQSNWIVPLGASEPERWRASVAKIRADGGTPLGEFIRRGIDELLKMRAAQRYGDYRLLVVTDGEANDERLLSSILPDVLARGITIDVIGVDMRSEHSLAARAHSYRRADDAVALERAVADVFAETASDTQDAAAEFDLLASLPDEFAVESLKALSNMQDKPIGAHAGTAGTDTPLPTAATTSGQPAPGSPTNASTPSNAGAFLSAVLGAVCCIGTVLGLFLFAFILIVVVSSRSRKH